MGASTKAVAATAVSVDLMLAWFRRIDELLKSTSESLARVAQLQNLTCRDSRPQRLEATKQGVHADTPASSTATPLVRMAVQGMPPSSLCTFRSAGTTGGASSLQGETHLLSAHQVFGEMPDPSERSKAMKGVVGTQRAVHCKEGTSHSAADQVFDAIPSAGLGADLNIRQVLSVTVHHMLHPITISVLHQVFGAYGVILKLSVVGKLGCCQVLVQYHTCESAAHAMKALQGRYIYDGCCQLDIKVATHSEMSVLENSSSMQSTPPSMTTTPKKQVPTFDGTNMNQWPVDCEKYFEMYKISQVLWIIAAEMNMIGDAALWLQAHKTKHVIESWEDLCALMLHAFGPGTDQKVLDSAEERHDIDDNKILNAQSATSQDSVYSQIQVSHMHCPISKKDECVATFGNITHTVEPLSEDSAEVLTHVGGSTLFPELCKYVTDEMVDETAPEFMVWDEEIVDHVVTHVGGMPFFLELGLDSAEKIFTDILM